MNELGNTPADKNYKPSGTSRAEEAARKAYPYDGGTKGWICKSSRPIFIKGYEAAEKDLALTIEDIERIDIMLCGTRANKHGAFTFSKLSDEQYAEVLKRYLEAKQ